MSRFIVLANKDYERHMTDEGNQLQLGLAASGWKLCGWGYDGLTDVKKIIDTYQPEIVFVQDKRDWDIKSPGTYNKQVHFTNIEYLKECKNIYKVSVVKDAGTVVKYQENFICNEIDADLVCIYYHENSVTSLSPFLKDRNLCRIYHTIDRTKIPQNIIKEKNFVISGAVSDVYKFRQLLVNNANKLGIDILKHPGYNNTGTSTNNYLNDISKYKFSFATCSNYGFALRKIIEGLACQCRVITNLPEYDILPFINDCIIRVDSNISVNDLQDLLNKEMNNYCGERLIECANKSLMFYDYREQGRMLHERIQIECRKWRESK
jgi:hypothetical protein